jgi:hypothetical protein
MKKIVLLFILTTVVATPSTYAQLSPSVGYTPYSEILGWYSPNKNGESELFGNWQYDNTQTNNYTTGGGSGGIRRGTSPRNLTYTMTNNIRGRIVQVRGNNAGDQSSETTTIIGKVGDNELTLTGFAVDRRGRQRTSAEPVVVWSQNNGVRMGSYNFIGGNYVADADGFSAGVFRKMNHLKIDGASFYGADNTGTDSDGRNFGGNGIHTVTHLRRLNDGTLENHGSAETVAITGDEDTYFMGGNGGSATRTSSLNYSSSITGGIGVYLTSVLGDITLGGANFIGGGNADDNNPRRLIVNGFNSAGNAARAEGGSGAVISGGGNGSRKVGVTGGTFVGGRAGITEVVGSSSLATSFGGYGIHVTGRSDIDIVGGTFQGGQAASASIQSLNEMDDYNGGSFVDTTGGGRAYAYGGHGVNVIGNSGTLDITDALATGGRGGSAAVFGSNSLAHASGGSGVRSYDSTVINSGTYQGGDGGNAIVSAEDPSNRAFADGGSGVQVIGASLTINGGTFSGGTAGSASGPNTFARAGRGVWAEGADADVTINDITGTNTVINDGIYFASGNALSIQGGTINGSILFDGTKSSSFTVSSNATLNGSIIQNGGTVGVTLSDAGASAFFKDVSIDGTMDFGNDFNSSPDTLFFLESPESAVEFNSLTLNDGSGIMTGFGQVRTTTGNIEIGADSGMLFFYDGWTTNATSPMFGTASIAGGQLVMTNANSELILMGVAATNNGSVRVVSAGSATDFGANNPYDVVMVDLGWLIQTNNIDSTAGITVDFEYNALSSNSALADLGPVLLGKLDDTITNSNFVADGEFYGLNSKGQVAGERLVRYSTAQLPDVADAAFQVQQQVSGQIAARGTEFRSMNGYASSRPTFGMETGPLGAAGPGTEGNEMQGWVRAYGAFAERDTESTFTDYDSHVYGTVIGVDQSFGNLLIGLAGGYARGSIDAGNTYDADVDTYHGTVYSTVGGESTYVDLAFTYGLSKTDVENIVADDKFDSHTASGYIGAGKSFSMKETVKITPEASFLISYYEQDAYDRAGILPISIKAYDEMSYLGALGASFASMHQMDWLSMGVAVLPELRMHWLHEFNADLNDFTYSSAGLPDQTFGVRSREEDLLKVGVGLDTWSWKRQNAKFEIDYDGIFGGDYEQHVLSGKVTVKF